MTLAVDVPAVRFAGLQALDQVAGNRLGREIATYVYKNNLRKANGPK